MDLQHVYVYMYLVYQRQKDLVRRLERLSEKPSLEHDILKAIHDFSSFQSVDYVLWTITFLPLTRMYIKKRLATHNHLRWESEPL
jgi:hypothetical protein